MKREKVIAYYRVSTARQGQSGLGLEAQQASVAAFCKARGYRVLESFQDVESGKHDDRPELQKALSRAKAEKATLLIAKLDRLSRNASFIMNLRDSGAAFQAVDMPDANTFTIGVMAAMAQQEREYISTRTKAALQALKARGKKLGGDRGGFTDKTRELATSAKKRNARTAANGALTHAVNYRKAGWRLQDIANALNKSGATTRRGKLFTPTQVSRLLKMAEGEGVAE